MSSAVNTPAKTSSATPSRQSPARKTPANSNASFKKKKPDVALVEEEQLSPIEDAKVWTSLGKLPLPLTIPEDFRAAIQDNERGGLRRSRARPCHNVEAGVLLAEIVAGARALEFCGRYLGM